jgi:hypothetical protein
MDTKIILRAVREGEQLATYERKDIDLLKTIFDGYKLTELDLHVVLNCADDFDKLITLLNIHKRCFTIKH